MEVDNLSARLQRMEQFLAQDPGNLNLFHDCCEICFQLGEFDKAQKLIDDAEQHHTSEPSIQFCQSKIFLATEQYQQALDCLLALMQQGVSNSGVVYNTVWAELNLGHYDSILTRLEQSVPMFEEYPPLLLVKVRALHHLQKFQDAINTVDEYLKLDASNADAYGLKAILLLDIGSLADAKESAEKALTINPYNHEALTTLSSVALTSQEPEEAIKYLNVKSELTAKSGRMMLNLGQAHMLNMEFDKAEGALKEAVSLMASHIGSWHALAWVEIVLGKIDDAKRCFERAMELDRNFSESHGGLAIIAIYQEQVEVAEKMAKTAIRLDPMSFSGRYAESLLLEYKGDLPAAQNKVKEMISSSTGANGQPITELIEKAGKRLNLSSQNKTIH